MQKNAKNQFYLQFSHLFALAPDQRIMSRISLHRVFARWMVEVSRNRPKQVLLPDPGKLVRIGDGSGGEDVEVVAVQVDRVGNWVAGAVWVHQEQVDHLGEGESLDQNKVRVNDQIKVEVGRK